MSHLLNDEAISKLLDNSGDEGSDAEEEQDIPGLNHYNESSSSELESSSDDEVPISELRWKKKKFNSKQVPNETFPDEVNPFLTLAQYFERYFTPELLEKFALATNQYYMTKTGSQMRPICKPEEIKTFFGIHGIMGCFKYPRIKLFWNQRYKFDPIAEAMFRDRFFLLRVNLYVMDVHAVNQAEEQSKNKLWRVQQVIDAVRNRCLELPRRAVNYSIDEQMIPFGGRCAGLKVVVKNKPRPEGLKNFVVTTSTGTVMDFEIYQGQTTNLHDVQKFGVGPAVILRLASTLPDRSFLYFDRYFTSLPLMQELTKRNKEGTGTLMMNRFNTVKSTKYMFKKDTSMKRGEHEEIVDANENICIVKWKDNKAVLMASTAFGAELTEVVSRCEKKSKRYLDVSCPAIVKNYNSNMGGVDTCDQLMESYRTWLKTRKWTLKVILHLFDLSVVNGWMEYKDDCKANKLKSKDVMDVLAFRLSISDFLLAGSPRSASQRNEPEFADMPSTSRYRVKPLPPLDRQLDGFNHWPCFDTLKQPRACWALHCTSRSGCTKCDVYLCLTKDRNCFYDFNTPRVKLKIYYNSRLTCNFETEC